MTEDGIDPATMEGWNREARRAFRPEPRHPALKREGKDYRKRDPWAGMDYGPVNLPVHKCDDGSRPPAGRWSG